MSGFTTLEIPVIDLERHRNGGGLGAAAAELREALEQVGFFFVVGHDIDWRVVDRVYHEAERFFALPDADKCALRIGGGLRGYMPLAQTRSVSSQVDDVAERRPNLVESVYFDYESRGRNQWPAELPGFRANVLAYAAAIDDLAHVLLPIYARALDLPAAFFAQYFKDPTVGLRLSHYPAAAGAAGPNDWGLSAHTDRSFMTLLPTNDVSGLWIRPEGSDWVEAPTVPGAFLVNAGDILRRWTNDRFLSTAHRVARPKRDRYAVPFFFSPDADTVLTSLPGCATASRPDRYEPITCGEFDRQFLKANYGSTDLLADSPPRPTVQDVPVQ